MSVVEAVDCSAVAGAAQSVMFSAVPAAAELGEVPSAVRSRRSWVMFGVMLVVAELGDVPGGRLGLYNGGKIQSRTGIPR